MQNNPLVTVICLCYNQGPYIVEALNSVINQTHKNIELIIADDFSTDNSVQVIENWLKENPAIPFIKNTENLGNTKTFNNAFKISKGAFLIDLAADDVLVPDCISKQLQGFKNSSFKNLGFIYGNAALISEDSSFLKDYFKTDSNRKRINLQANGDIYIGLLSGENTLCSVSALVKREVFMQLNGYDENLAYEDYDFWIRASRIYNLEYIDEILIKKRVLESSLYSLFLKKNNKRTRKFNYSTYIIVEKIFLLNRNKAEFKAMLKKIHYEMTVAFDTRDFGLLFKYAILELKVRLKIKTTNH
ncbi:glycosyltransferase family 2 protein [Flavobacterium tegetincola]|uniref:glycosyltransferase family 2 protein n=1 Tax=Flavobacterium tegetincola TaxID=150172 RepID=UPI0003F94A0E|nr:glycosyltransferase family A protein [Flavobacterium tegetincola]